MGLIVQFPDVANAPRSGPVAPVEGASATIIILPVVRVEYHPTNDGGPAEGSTPTGRRRRRRA